MQATTPTITTQPERRTKPALMPSLAFPEWNALRTPDQTQDRVGWFAEVEVSGFTLQVSRFDDEAGWTIDAAFRGSIPVWANGFGARYLLTKTANPEIAAALDAAVATLVA